MATANVAFYIFFLVFAFAKKYTNNPNSLPPISVIICAKNEEGNLKKNIPHILSQDYPDFEIILINDASQDATECVMETFASEHMNVQYVKVDSNERFWGKKKYALTLGIKRASYEHLLLTDADCYPNSDKWIREMSSSFQEKTEIVLGYGAYEKVKKSFLNKVIRFETSFTAIQYFSYALGGIPYMGVGRNLAYTTRLFYHQKGFVSHMDVQSGDDDLFVNVSAHRDNTVVQYNPESFTISEPKKLFKDWITQKRRHITSAHYYKKRDKFLLGLFYMSQLGFIGLSCVLVIFQSHWQWVLLIIFLRYLIAWISFGLGAKKLQEEDVVWLFPFLELFLITTQLSIFIVNRFFKPNRWK